MHDPEKSDSGRVAAKPTNKAGRPAAEPVEPRPGTKGNADQQSTHRTQSRVRVTQALDRVRQGPTCALSSNTRGRSRMPKSGPSGSVRGAPRNGRPYRDVRRETGKEYVVKVHCDEGVATHIGPEPCAGVREDVGEASAGEHIGQPLSREPINSGQRSETADGVARESEGRTRLPLLRPLRQDRPRRHPGACLCSVPLQQGRAGRRPSGLRGHRGVWGGAMAGRTGACAQAGDLPTGPYQASVHTESQRQTQAAGHLNRAGSGLHDSSDAGAGADLRSRPSTGNLRLPRWAQRPAGRCGGGGAAVPWPPGRRRRRPRGLLRKHSTRRPLKVGGAPDRGSRVLHLITMWLDCPVEEADQRGRKIRTTEARDQRRGIPQGSPLSPLLANLYMRRFVLGWKKLGLERSLGARLVTYADDLVILCRKGGAEAALHHLREIMRKLKLTVNEEKTRICRVPEGEFDFLGFTFGRMYSPTTGRARLALRPSKKSIRRMVEKVHELTDCQSASNFDPRSASKIDPLLVTGPRRQRSPRRSWSGLRRRGERGLARSCCL